MRISEKIEYRNVHDLMPHPKNEEFHSPPSDEELTLLRTSIQQDGVQEPLWITEEDMIISGHQRWIVARELKLPDVPVRLIFDASLDDLLYLLIAANETRRGDEPDLMKKARKIKFLHERWYLRKEVNDLTDSQVGNQFTQETINTQTDSTDTSAQSDAQSKYIIDSDIVKMAGGKSSFYRLLKLNRLIPELQELVSKGKIRQQAGVELASLPEEKQREMYAAIHLQSVDLVRADEIKAIRKELEKAPEKKTPEEDEAPSSPVSFINPPTVQTQQEEGENNQHERPLQTVSAVSKILSKKSADGVRHQILQDRSKRFNHKLLSFLKDLRASVNEIQIIPEDRDCLKELSESLTELRNELDKAIGN